MLFLAWNHLTSKVKQTLLTLMGITLGTAAYITISGMMMGFQSFILEQLVNNDAHIRISAREDFITKENVEKSGFDIVFTKPQSIINIANAQKIENRKI